jgi:hypothetical protein
MKVISLNRTDCKLELIHQNKLKILILDHPIYIQRPMLMVDAIILNTNNMSNMNIFYQYLFAVTIS